MIHADYPDYVRKFHQALLTRQFSDLTPTVKMKVVSVPVIESDPEADERVDALIAAQPKKVLKIKIAKPKSAFACPYCTSAMDDDYAYCGAEDCKKGYMRDKKAESRAKSRVDSKR